MYKQIKDNKGFTIIEVMIVLAIAALILIIVLLAVPALQRNARNTTVKNDASTVAAAVTEYEANNNGQVPTNVAQGGAGFPAYISVTGGTSQSKAVVAAATTVNAIGSVAAPASQSALTTALTGSAAASTVIVAPGEDCAQTSQGALQGAPTGDNSAVAVYYSTDFASGWAPGGCIQS